jgi:uncharacterized membrane protein
MNTEFIGAILIIGFYVVIFIAWHFGNKAFNEFIK